MKRVEFIIISLYIIIATCSATVAPGDEDQECLASPNRPSTYNREVLMASFNYMNLLENDGGGPWIVVDEYGNNDTQDNDTFYIPTVQPLYTLYVSSGIL